MKKNSYRSRLSRRLEKRTKQNLFLSIVGILFITILIIKFGIPFLVDFSLFISSSKTTQELPSPNSGGQFISSPVLNPTFTATNSAETKITGVSAGGQTINLYVNNNLVDSGSTQSNGKFSFAVTLNQGENKIQAKAKKNNIESDFSNTLYITFVNSPPSLTIDSPLDGDSFSKDKNTVTVAGKTDAGVRVTVNGFWAVMDENNNFSYTLPLKNGDNQIKIVATDQAGNTTEKDIKVSYSP